MATSIPESSDPAYTVFIRLPFPRGGFIDPPPVEWDSVKDKVLWKIISKTSKSRDVDWSGLAEKFDVSLPFLLQQAAWLYERELSKVRAQMRKVGASKGSASPMLGSDSTAGSQRAPFALSARKDALGIAGDRPQSQTSSTISTAPQAFNRGIPQISPRLQKATPYHTESSAQVSISAKRRSPSPTASLSSNASSSDHELPTRSRLLRRPPRLADGRNNRSGDADDDDDVPAFMKFSNSVVQDSSSTLTTDVHTQHRAIAKHPETMFRSQTSDSSSGSAPIMRPINRDIRRLAHGPLSPKKTADLVGTSTRGKSRESDGSPSMGSSFSDLDEASVTQSAMDEALTSGSTGHDTMARRISNFGAFARSRYSGK